MGELPRSPAHCRVPGTLVPTTPSQSHLAPSLIMHTPHNHVHSYVQTPTDISKSQMYIHTYVHTNAQYAVVCGLQVTATCAQMKSPRQHLHTHVRTYVRAQQRGRCRGLNLPQLGPVTLHTLLQHTLLLLSRVMSTTAQMIHVTTTPQLLICI